MGEFVLEDESAFLDLVTSAQEIVLPGATGLRPALQRTSGAYYDVTTDCIDLTEGMPSYGSC